MRLFGTSGIRRLADGYLLELALKAGLAVGRRYSRVVVGNDTRTSGPAIKDALTAGLLAGGAKVYDAGLLPTPTLALSARDLDCAVMVTASHNPPEYNGLKMLNPDGSAFSPDQQHEIEKTVAESSFETISWEEYKPLEVRNCAIEQQIEHILRDFPHKFNIKVVLDCGGGAGSVITPFLLQKMGCDVISINSNPTGFFPRISEPVEDNLGDLMQKVKECGADLGLAHDGDADRVMAVDERGRFINGDKLLYILAQGLRASKIVTTVDASMMLDEAGFSVQRTAVGDNCVSEALKSGGDFGGEPSGAWVFPQSSLCPDGIYGAGLLVSIASRQSLATLVDDIPGYPMYRGVVHYGGKIPFAMETSLISAFQPISVVAIDGLKLNLTDAWLLVRPSGTEPKLRLTVEARTETRMQEVYNKAMDIIKEQLNP
jgi:phosphoglucosamine mutase